MTDESLDNVSVKVELHGGFPIGPAGDRLDRTLGFVIAVYAIVVRAYVLLTTHSTHEDFLITLRYAENIASGRGFVYNVGEHVLGTTTPLYTLLLALATWIHLDPVLVGKGVNILASGATCYVIVLLGAAIGRSREGWFASLLYASTSAPINFSIGGMETGLVTLAGMAAIHGFITGRSALLWITLATLFLLRIDGALLAIILFIGWIRLYHTVPVRGFVPAILIVAPWIVFAWIYFGSIIPAPVTAKLIVYSHTIPRRLPNLAEFKRQFIPGAPQIVLALGFIVGVVAVWSSKRSLRAPIVWLAVYYGTMFLSKVPAFGWYFVPPLPLYYFVSVTGWAAIGKLAFPLTASRLNSRFAVAALLLLSVPLTWRIRSVSRDIAQAQQIEDEVRRPMGEWLRGHTRPDERIMLEPIGYVGYYSRLPVLDDIGLVSPEALKFYQSGSAYPLVDMARGLQPDLLLLRFGERAQFIEYQHVKAFDPFAEYRFVRAWPNAVSGPMFFLYRISSGSKTGRNSQRRVVK